MRRVISAQWITLAAHLAAMLFGLVGLLLVMPNTEFIESLSELGLQIFALGMQGGGAVFMILGAISISLYGWHTLGAKRLFAFLIPSVFLSLGSELLGTSTGFPFGGYSYLSGLGTKIAGLVPFTIPLSWFYMGLACFLIANTTLRFGNHWMQRVEAIALGAMMLTSWDFVLDPAMSQAAFPFWEWHQPGAFFGMPLQNFAGWMGTGALFMTVASLLWGKDNQPVLNRKQLVFPVIMYIGNFVFATILSCGASIYPPIFLGLLLGVAPVLGMWFSAAKEEDTIPSLALESLNTSSIALPKSSQPEVAARR
ncbi:gamma-carotene 1'-hydroxylase CruF [Tumidithrix helvetica PCC 7403]|uniref:gamma-carotene 1'-hydroxylase CruF n=1 Tax=Tumidithrix helvetica TaxID=3457545 RepID=UPI003C9C35A6